MKPATKTILTELAWMLGNWVFSFALVWRLGGSYAGTLDIQMHNTYFVVPVWVLATLFFLVLAPLVTSARILVGRGQNKAASFTLAGLSAVWLLIIFGVVLARWLR